MIYNRFRILWEPKFVMSDFEQGLINAIKFVFPKTKVLGCYFHFVKALWNRANKIGLRCKKYMLLTKLMLGYFKILIHLPLDCRKDLLNSMKKLFSDIKVEIIINFASVF